MAPTIPDAGTPAPPSPPRIRRKRAQVVRACDWCRKQRIKCDNDQPCLNCKTRGAQCSNEVIEVSTLPHAYREIDRLRRQVRDLERQLQQQRERGADTPSTGVYLTSAPSHVPTPDVPAGAAAIENSSQQKYWGGIHVRTSRSPHDTWYGPSSLYFFLGRVANFMSSSTLHGDPVNHMLLPKASSSILFDAPPGNSPADDSNRTSAAMAEDTMTARSYLNPTQEEFFLDLYWQSFHTGLCPILHEAEFKEYYRSLWADPGQPRKPSALVDILLALCMQRGVAAMASVRGDKPVAFCDASIAGRQHFRRYRRLVQYEMESPTIATLQSHLLCTIYLGNGTFTNMADSEFVIAARTAYMLGLHKEPPPALPYRERELRKRLWWSLYMIDAKLGNNFGRPFQLYRSSAEPSLPEDGCHAVMESGSHFASPSGDTSWLSFHIQQIKLFITAREVHTAFYSKRLDIRDDQTIWDDPNVLEAHAQFMQPYLNTMEEWKNRIPSALKTRRQGNGEPLSTDGTAIDMEQFSPVWLQRQRVLLELMYHNLCVYQLRPFITFSSTPSGPLAEQSALKSALHAITLTNLLHQVLTTSPIMAGWHEAFFWQWNAVVTLAGFVLAYPRSPSNPTARRAIDVAVTVFDMFTDSCLVSGGAADITRKLAAQVDLLMQLGQGVTGVASNGWVGGAPTPGFVDGSLVATGLDAPGTSDGSMSLDFSDGSVASAQDVFQMVAAVDQWSGLDLLWPPGDTWSQDVSPDAQ